MRVALGTVQFGLNYGVSNSVGVAPLAEVARMLLFCREHSIEVLDTAASYGNSESVLGRLNVDGFQIVSKLPTEFPGDISVFEWVLNSVGGSLLRLRQQSLYGILLHRPSMLFEAGGGALYRALQQLRADGIISKIGVSIYGPEELSQLFDNFDFDLVQAPLSLIDQRMILSGWLRRLTRHGVEVHVRSVFLQGLLLTHKDERPRKFDRWAIFWRDWDSWLDDTGLSPVEACIRHALSYSEVGRVIVGAQSLNQLREIVSAAVKPPIDAPFHLNVSDPNLLNPHLWKKL